MAEEDEKHGNSVFSRYLHGMHLGSAFLIMLQWMDEMRGRLSDERHGVPDEITVVVYIDKEILLCFVCRNKLES